jgi:hypothetical protein
MDEDRIIHVSPFSEWFATQDTSARGVWLCDKTSDQRVLVQPPTEWGRDWSWNIAQDGTGIYIKRNFA